MINQAEQSPDSSNYLADLSQFAMGLVRLPRETDIYNHIAQQLKALVGDAVVSVTSYAPETREMHQRALVGAAALLEKGAGIVGFSLRGLRQSLNDEAIRQIHTGRLMKLDEGLYELFNRTVPRPITKAMERIGEIREVYGMGLVANGQCFGSVALVLRRQAQLPPIEVVEAYVNLAAVTHQRRQAEEALQHSEQRYQSLMEEAADAYIVATPEGEIREVNAALCNGLGYSRDELIGRSATELMDPGDLAARPLQWAFNGSPSKRVDTRRLRRKDGTEVWYEAHVAPLSEGSVLVTARDITERRRLEHEVIDVGERERRELGHDLHDSLGQELTGIGMLCKALEKRLALRGEPEHEEAARISLLVRDAIAQSRRIAQGLCPVEMTAEGLVVSLERLAQRLSGSFNIPCSLTVDSTGPVPTGSLASHLYLIAQEAATNALRHGASSEVSMHLAIREPRGELRVSDDGGGLPPDPEPGGGLGLRTMRYRAEMIDGTLAIDSDAGGTTITCTFPVPREQPAAGFQT